MSEHTEQGAVFSWARSLSGRHPALRNLFAIPNAGKRSIGAANWMKAEGLESGVPDIFLAWPAFIYPTEGSMWPGLFIEMKYGDNKTTSAQNDWIERLRDAGYRVEVCYSADEAIEVIKNYLDIEVDEAQND